MDKNIFGKSNNDFSMSTCVNTIKRLLWVLAGIILLTYLISLNMEIHFIALNAKWISNNFFFTISGGAFASLVIVLVCEIIKYFQLKKMAENTLFINLGNLYGQFLIIRSNCIRALNSQDIISDSIIEQTCENASKIADYINGIDYTPFCKKNKVKDIVIQYNSMKLIPIKIVIISFTFLKIAIQEDKKILLQQGRNANVTSCCPNTNKALNKVISQTSTILTYLDQIITQIDNELGNKYQWKNRKQAVNTYQDNYIGQTLENYLKEAVVVF